MRLTPSVIFLFLANLLPLAGVFWWQWSVFAVMLVFWLENILIGVLNVPKMLLAGGDTDGKYVRIGKRLPLAIFFCVHYGMFCFGHGVFVFALFAEAETGLQVGNDLTVEVVLQVIEIYQLYWALVALFVSHAISLALNFMLSDEAGKITVKQVMNQPYHRIVVLHIALIAGGFLVQSLQQPFLGLVALIVIKIILDIRAHLKEHPQGSDKMPHPEQVS